MLKQKTKMKTQHRTKQIKQQTKKIANNGSKT